MADLNGELIDVHRRAGKIEKDLLALLKIYEDIHHNANHELMEQRQAARGSMVGLESFYRLVQTLRRNRDVVGSMVRGIHNLRPLHQEFRVIEEDEPQKIEQEIEPLAQEILIDMPSGPDEFPVISADEEPIVNGEPNG